MTDILQIIAISQIYYSVVWPTVCVWRLY